MRPDELRERILEYVDGVMDPAAAEEFRDYLSRHPEVARHVDQLRQTDRWLGMLEKDGVSGPGGDLAHVADAVLQRANDPLAAEESVDAVATVVTDGTGGARILRPRFVSRVASVAALLVISLGLWTLSRPDDVETQSGGTVSSTKLRPGEQELLEDPDFIANFELIQALDQLEEWSEVLDTEHEGVFFDAMTLEVIAGV